MVLYVKWAGGETDENESFHAALSTQSDIGHICGYAIERTTCLSRV